MTGRRAEAFEREREARDGLGEGRRRRPVDELRVPLVDHEHPDLDGDRDRTGIAISCGRRRRRRFWFRRLGPGGVGPGVLRLEQPLEGDDTVRLALDANVRLRQTYSRNLRILWPREVDPVE